MIGENHDMTVRTRIAPSPTGSPHVGTAYVALFNMCFARQHGGQFILRIEDTDQARSHPKYEQQLLASFRWLGLQWDEGPDVGGQKGPYRQSERSEVYQEYAEQLVNMGHAFYCFRTPEELEQIRETRKANGLNTGIKLENPELPPEEVAARLQAGDSYVIRMKVPDDGVCVVEDVLRGSIEIEWAQVDMQILLKSDGMPTYHLANVVDDHLMGITHVIRGEEWINSAPKHLKLYEYFDWPAPKLCHLPLLRNPDQSKLSKRKNPTSIFYYERMGYLPEALLNYLGRMGWSMPNGEEKFTLEEMVAHFDITRVSLGGPVFDIQKLNWLNATWIRENLDLDEFINRVKAWSFNQSYLGKVAAEMKDRVALLSEIGDKAGFFFNGLPMLPEDFVEQAGLTHEESRKVLQFSLWFLEALIEWHEQALSQGLKKLAQSFELKMKFFMAPIFIAISGNKVATPIISAMEILGQSLSCARLRHAIQFLGGVSKKEQKKWVKEYASIDFDTSVL